MIINLASDLEVEETDTFIPIEAYGEKLPDIGLQLEERIKEITNNNKIQKEELIYNINQPDYQLDRKRHNNKRCNKFYL